MMRSVDDSDFSAGANFQQSPLWWSSCESNDKTAQSCAVEANVFQASMRHVPTAASVPPDFDNGANPERAAGATPPPRFPMTGLVYAALAYILWGLFPIYFHALARVGALEIVLHRSLWSFVFVWALLVALRRLQWVPGVVRQPRLVAQFVLSAFLLSANWLLYVWAVNHGHVVEASLGYFVTPLVNVMLGTWVLKERPRRL